MKADDYTTCKQCGEMVECDEAHTLDTWDLNKCICNECVEENKELEE